ncbi:unnamed protein product [Candidula unifasciata]|uniref:Uncharacterized protein n=1 Tax=Candidula unifasciata TaxID=100452 RepID=A0A8S3ZWK2_9EUPU|nr:unnamed protein product [Candidula unifasciata]
MSFHARCGHTVLIMFVFVHTGESENRLINDLFDKNFYNPLIRPVVNASDSLNISFNLALSQIINVDEVNQVMKTNVWLQVYWHDYQLRWDPILYSNIGSIRIKPDKVWVPDFVLFNNADGNFEVTYKSNCVLYANSEVHWIPPAIYHSSCSIDMKFGSWTHKGKALKYSFYKNRDKLDLVDYLKSGSWDIIDCPGKIVTYRDDVNGDDKEQIIFQFVIRRKSLFYTVNLIIPCVLISFVTVCVFALPADAGEKIALCISLLLALVVFLLLVSKILPPSLNIPLIAKYLLFTFVMNLVAILSTVIIINRNYRTPRTHKMPYWVRVIFLRELPKYLLMTRPDHYKRWQGAPTPAPSFEASSDPCQAEQSTCRDFVELSPLDQPAKSCYTTESTDSPHITPASRESPRYTPVSSNENDYENIRYRHPKEKRPAQGESSRAGPSQGDREETVEIVMTTELKNTIDSVKFIYQHLRDEEEYETVLEDWKYVARVLDRLCLIVFLLVTIGGTATVLLNAPHILEYVDQDQIIRNLVQYIRQAEAKASM